MNPVLVSVAVLAFWTGIALAIAPLIGRGIRAADRALAPLDDPLADQPVDCLSAAEIDRRFAHITAQLSGGKAR